MGLALRKIDAKFNVYFLYIYTFKENCNLISYKQTIFIKKCVYGCRNFIEIDLYHIKENCHSLCHAPCQVINFTLKILYGDMKMCSLIKPLLVRF